MQRNIPLLVLCTLYEATRDVHSNIFSGSDAALDVSRRRRRSLLSRVVRGTCFAPC